MCCLYGRRFKDHIAAKALNNTLDQIKAKAGALNFRRFIAISAEKRLKELNLFAFGDAVTVVR